MEPCRKCGKALDCAKHFFINTRMSSEMFEGKKGIRSTSSIVHRPCPYCKELKPLFAQELKTYTRMFLRLLIAASVCGLYVAVDPQIFDPPDQGINSIFTWTAVFTGGLFAVFAILHGISYLMKKSQG
jgi:phage FluMu protein Com